MGEELSLGVDDLRHGVGVETYPHGEDVQLVELADEVQELLVVVPDSGMVPGEHGTLPQLEMVNSLQNEKYFNKKFQIICSRSAYLHTYWYLYSAFTKTCLKRFTLVIKQNNDFALQVYTLTFSSKHMELASLHK